MTVSKAWDWTLDTSPHWLVPCEESHYLAARWAAQGRRDLLDLGCGRGRHAIFFAQKGFSVSAFDLSQDAVEQTRGWALRERLSIGVRQGDMLALPYPDAAFDAVFAMHVLSHTDTAGIRVILSELFRVLRPGGEFFLTLCAKDTWSFTAKRYPLLDENTVVKTEGAEAGIPHFFADLDDIERLFSPVRLLRVRHTDDCLFEDARQCSVHYFILGTNASKTK